MIEGEVFGEFVATTHFVDRWYERTNIPSGYFDLVIQNELYIRLGENSDGNVHYMFSCPKDSEYYIFIVIEDSIKTILTEKIYKSVGFDMVRAKKQLKKKIKTLRELWSNLELHINGVVSNRVNMEKVDDPIWTRITNIDGFIKNCDDALNDTKLIESHMYDYQIPVKPVFTYEVFIGNESVFYREIRVPILMFKRIKKDRENGVHNVNPDLPMNRRQRRILEKTCKK